MEKMTTVQTILAASAVAAMITGLGGWFGHLMAKPKPLTSVPIIRPVCTPDFPVGFAPEYIVVSNSTRI